MRNKLISGFGHSNRTPFVEFSAFFLALKAVSEPDRDGL